MCMHHVVIRGLSSSAIFSTLCHKQHDFRKNKNFFNTKCVLWFTLHICLKYFSFYEEMSEVWSKMSSGLHVQYPLFLSDFIETRIFSTNFRKILKCQISLKFFQWERSCSKHTEWWTDEHMTKLTVARRNFPNAPKNNSEVHTRENFRSKSTDRFQCNLVIDV